MQLEKNMEIIAHGRKINKETLANASNSTKGLGSRTGSMWKFFTTSLPALSGASTTGTARNGRSTTTMTSRRSVLRYDTRHSSRSRT